MKEIKAGYLNRRRIGELFSLDNYYTASPKVSLFLCQFEFVKNYDILEMVVRNDTKERFPVDYVTTEQAAKLRTGLGYARKLGDLFNAFSLLEPFIDGLPTRQVLDSVNVFSIAKKSGAKPEEHHRTIPVPVALHTLNASIDYIIKYGDAIVDYSLAWGSKFKELRGKLTHEYKETYRAAKWDAFKSVPKPKALHGLNIKRLFSWYGGEDVPRNTNGGHGAANLCRKSLPFEDAIHFLISAVFVLVAAMSARRRAELVGISIDCLEGYEGCYEVTFELCKANFEDERERISRPIPNIAARAIKMLQRFTRGWMEVYGDNSNDKLFYLPNSMNKGRPIAYSTVADTLARFCDYIEVPLYEDGRRWYIKMHEFRRFFAIVFFWQYKFANLTALQWMLGHVDPRHTYNYIRDIVGGTEINKEEARYTAAVMREGTSGQAVEQLRQLAFEHFHTTDISLIEEEDLQIYLEELIEEGKFRIRPHGIETTNGVTYEIVFEIS